MSILTVENIKISNEDQIIIQDVSFSVSSGEWLALIGESGSGKSVTSSAIGGILPKPLKVQSGSIFFEGSNMLHKSEKQLQPIRGNQISYIFQDYQGAFAPFLTIGKQFDETLKTHTKLSKKERIQCSLQAIKKVSLPEKRVYDSYPFQLSGGQLQRAAIALAILLKPKLLIADESTTALDSVTTASILDLIKDLKDQMNCAVLFISHDLRQVKKHADTIAIMKQGRIVETGKTMDVFNQPQHEYTKKLFASIPPLKNPPSRLLALENKKVWKENRVSLKQNNEQTIILQANGISKRFKHHAAVKDVSLTINRGECVGLVGESGSGKSTLAKCLLLLERMNTGEMSLNGFPMHNMKKKALYSKRKEVQAVFQNPAQSLNPKLRIIDSLMEPLDVQNKKQIEFLNLECYDRKQVAAKLLDIVHIPSRYMNLYPHELSGGQKQRVVIAKAISVEPSLIILDEPTSSLDVSVQAQLLNLLKDLQEKFSFSYLFISHDLAAVNFMSDRTLVMKDGMIVDECNKDNMFKEERNEYTKQLLHIFES
ncbi:dipeptide ABC transporter ATP-binding protein [Longirhabdus pacifica]|uniref:dipeptide ABC transporter ATP-binding protein n=1 Tax=Longirhabdus pacifica TaxID=2305227 RepID=UPI001008F579|nr:ABC transporter ATP-binding protein [Longirhabdus pacifica]